MQPMTVFFHFPFRQIIRWQYVAELHSVEHVSLAVRHAFPTTGETFFWANDVPGVSATARHANAAIQ